jgi:imidazolonepropionase-like amidohydrolase
MGCRKPGIAVAVLAFCFTCAWAEPPTVIHNATVLTVTKGTIPNASILIRDGRIADVGTKITVPAGAKVIDAGGQ